MPNFEARGIVEFDISSLSGTIFDATLLLGVFRSLGPFPFDIDVFAYSSTANGSVGLDDWDAGLLLTTFAHNGEGAVSLDVTSFVQGLVAANEDFAGFRFEFSIPSSIPVNGPFIAFNSVEIPPAAMLEINGGEPPEGDTTSPRCEVIGVNIAHAPPPTNLLVEVQDTGSGLDAINGLIAKNAVVNIPAFSVGTNGVIQVVADKIDESKRSRVEIQAIDVAGNSSTCDPVLATLTRDSRTLPLTGIASTERYLTISPNGPSGSTVMVNVNGTWFQFGVDQQSVTIDLGSAMAVGSDNTVTLWASSDTTILLSDVVPKNASISPAARPWWHSAWSQAP